MTPDLELSADDLVDLIYDLQGTLRLLTELLARRQCNPLSQRSWGSLMNSQFYLRHDLSRQLH